MTQPRRSLGSAPAIAGSLLVGTIIACAAVGYGLGSLVGVPVPLGIVGVLVGPVAGIAVVRSRFRDI
jgi:hypothetical protein